MISDCVENCLQYLNNFNPKKSKNPFAYFTQIIYYAFVGRIQKEKKQINIKYKLLEDANLDDMTLNTGDDGDYKNGKHIGENLYENDGFIVHFFSEEKVKKVADGFTVVNIENF